METMTLMILTVRLALSLFALVLAVRFTNTTARLLSEAQPPMERTLARSLLLCGLALVIGIIIGLVQTVVIWLDAPELAKSAPFYLGFARISIWLAILLSLEFYAVNHKTS